MLPAQKKARRIFQVLSLLGIMATVVLVIYAYQAGIFQSAQALHHFLASFGYWSVFIFILIQIVQVVIPIIPGGITLAVGVVAFGPVYGFIYNYIGIVIGSVINFLLARRYGKSFILSVVSQKTYDKYIGWIDKGTQFDRFFALAILFPIAPDDFLCLLAGLTKMTFKKFIAIILLCKPATVFLFGSGLSLGLEWLSELFS